MSRYEEVELGTIEQGDFLSKADVEFSKLARAMVKHVQDELPGGKGKAEGTLALKVKIIYQDQSYKIVTDIENKPPKKHLGGVSVAMVEESQTGQPCLFAQAGGSSVTHPKQKILCNDDGSKIDQPS